jgi:hypothetical protein
MIAVALATESCIRPAVEHAPQTPMIAVAVNSKDLLGSFIFDPG